MSSNQIGWFQRWLDEADLRLAHVVTSWRDFHVLVMTVTFAETCSNRSEYMLANPRRKEKFFNIVFEFFRELERTYTIATMDNSLRRKRLL